MSSTGFKVFEVIAVIGLGLIGGSFAKDVRRLNLAKIILGYDQNSEYLKQIASLNLSDYVSGTIDSRISEANLVMLAVPVKSFSGVIAQIKPFLKPDTIVTDAGSVKTSLVELMSHEENAGISFIGGHPIAGAERFGPQAAQDNLFRGKRFILTPNQNTKAEVTARVRELWEAIGANVLEMDAQSHDKIFASVSHLPHLLAFATIQAIADADHPEVLGHSGAGLKDFSRIASSSPEMWADIFLENEKFLLPRVEALQKVMKKLELAILHQDKEALVKLLAEAKEAKDRWMV